MVYSKAGRRTRRGLPASSSMFEWMLEGSSGDGGRQASIRQFTIPARRLNNSCTKQVARQGTIDPMSKGSSPQEGKTRISAPLIVENDSKLAAQVEGQTSSAASSEKMRPHHQALPPEDDDKRPQQGKKRKTSNNKPMQQLYLDFGQRNFAENIECPICGMLYVHGEASDAKQHSVVCDEFQNGIKFDTTTGRIVWSQDQGQRVSPSKPNQPGESIVEIRSPESSQLRNKVSQVTKIVEKELGFAEPENDEFLTTYLYVSTRRVVGMVRVELIQRGYALMSNNLERSTDARKAILGIYQIWVHSKHRCRGIASQLVDAARHNFVYGMVVPLPLVAFSSPTAAGANFARRYSTNKAETVAECVDSEEALVLVYDCH